jgi:hypothetical protein
VPYELAFIKHLAISDREKYWNDCCVGGDFVRDALLPVVGARYDGIETNQEDWGWFIWFSESGVDLAVDIFCDDAERGEFRVHLTSRVRRFLFGAKVSDTPELETLREEVAGALGQWAEMTPRLTKLNDKYMPLENAG